MEKKTAEAHGSVTGNCSTSESTTDLEQHGTGALEEDFDRGESPKHGLPSRAEKCISITGPPPCPALVCRLTNVANLVCLSRSLSKFLNLPPSPFPLNNPYFARLLHVQGLPDPRIVEDGCRLGSHQRTINAQSATMASTWMKGNMRWMRGFFRGWEDGKRGLGLFGSPLKRPGGRAPPGPPAPDDMALNMAAIGSSLPFPPRPPRESGSKSEAPDVIPSGLAPGAPPPPIWARSAANGFSPPIPMLPGPPIPIPGAPAPPPNMLIICSSCLRYCSSGDPPPKLRSESGVSTSSRRAANAGVDGPRDRRASGSGRNRDWEW